MLRTTPFHSRTDALCQAQNWRRWAGYLAASSYELHHHREYWAIRNSAALLDVSPLYKYVISGPDAVALLDRVVTRAVDKCAVGQVLYTGWCDEDGKMLDDGTICRLTEDQFRMTSAEPNLRWLADNSHQLNVSIVDATDSIAALALQGPNSRALLSELAGATVDDLRFFRSMSARLGTVAVEVTRTGYTGDLGYEIWTQSDQAEALWDVLIDAGKAFGLQPAGMLALDMARIEAGLVLIGVDYVPARRAIIESRKSSPFELGLGWTVKLDKSSNFVGRDALLAERERGPEWEFKGVEISWKSLEEVYGVEDLPPQLPSEAWRTSVPLYRGSRQVGYATSGCWSPVLKRYIALAHLRVPYSAPGTELQIEVTVEHKRRTAEARVVDLPFFNPSRKRS